MRGMVDLICAVASYCFRGNKSTVPEGIEDSANRLVAPQHAFTVVQNRDDFSFETFIHQWPSWL